jgi:uncharacterized membrane protein
MPTHGFEGSFCMTVKTHRRRTLATATTYRITSTLLLAAISWGVTGQWIESLVVTLSFAFLATALYYFNDRAWERTDWGRKGESMLDITGSRPSKSTLHAGSPEWSDIIPVVHEFLEEAS